MVECFPQRSGIYQRPLTTSSQHYTVLRPTQHNEVRKRNEKLFAKREIKLSSFTDDIIIYMESLMESTKKISRTNERV